MRNNANERMLIYVKLLIPVEIAGLEIWNHNKNLEMTYVGVIFLFLNIFYDLWFKSQLRVVFIRQQIKVRWLQPG